MVLRELLDVLPLLFAMGPPVLEGLLQLLPNDDEPVPRTWYRAR